MWLELSRHVDSEALFNRAIANGISIAPGLIFSASRRYKNFIRLSFGHPWSADIEEAIRWLGHEVSRAAKAA
jgi:DNA-binding transcriptional MocR family regulator